MLWSFRVVLGRVQGGRVLGGRAGPDKARPTGLRVPDFDNVVVISARWPVCLVGGE